MKLRASLIRLHDAPMVEIFDLDHDGVRLGVLSLAEARDLAARLLVLADRREAQELLERVGDTQLGAALEKELEA